MNARRVYFIDAKDWLSSNKGAGTRVLEDMYYPYELQLFESGTPRNLFV
ncbi:MAG: hypothetical protein M1518_00015 [Candidatus Thermoplasmatota archaeon]|jgi:hypothetical protein|nr:hypothetical protein [Candidatus Thermoplasmatota archaeon]